MESIKRELRVIRNNNGSPVLQRIIKWAIFLGVARETTRHPVVPSVGVRTPYHGRRRAHVLQAQDRCMDETLGRIQGRPGLVVGGLASSSLQYPMRDAGSSERARPVRNGLCGLRRITLLRGWVNRSTHGALRRIHRAFIADR